MTRLLVCGGRWYDNRANVFRVLDRAAAKWRISTLIHGGCKRWSPRSRAYVGADFLAGEWALDFKEYPIEVEVFEAKWKTDDGAIDKAAGIFRNGVMLAMGRPDVGIAFRGESGTADMVRRLRLAQVECYTIGFEVEETT